MAIFFIPLILWISFIPETVSGRYKNIIYIILGLFLFASFLKTKKLKYFWGNKLDILIWLFLLWNIVVSIFAENSNISWKRCMDFAIPWVTLYFLSKNELHFRGLKFAIYTLFFSGIAVSAIGILEFIFNKNIIYTRFVQNPFYLTYVNYPPRIMSTMLHPVVLGTYLMCCLPASYFVLGEARTKIKKLMAILGLFSILTALVFTFTRMSWLAALVVTNFHFYKKNKKISLSIFFYILLFCTAVLFAVILKPKLLDRIDSGSMVNYLIKGHRLQRFPLTVKMLKTHPYLGVGLDNYRYVFDKYYGPNKVPYLTKIPDNMYLMIAGESGLVGIGLFMLLIIHLIKSSFTLLKDKENPERELILVLFSGLIGVLVHMASYELFYWTSPFFLFLLFLGGVSRHFGWNKTWGYGKRVTGLREAEINAQ